MSLDLLRAVAFLLGLFIGLLFLLMLAAVFYVNVDPEA